MDRNIVLSEFISKIIFWNHFYRYFEATEISQIIVLQIQCKFIRDSDCESVPTPAIICNRFALYFNRNSTEILQRWQCCYVVNRSTCFDSEKQFYIRLNLFKRLRFRYEIISRLIAYLLQCKLVRYLEYLPPVVKTSGNFNVFKWRSLLAPKANAQV